MATLNDNVARTVDAFDNIRDAIIAKGQAIPAGTPVEDYAAKIQAISGGGGGEPNIVVGLSPLSTKNPGDFALLKHGNVYRLFVVLHKGLPSSDYVGWENGVALMQYELPVGRQWYTSNQNNYEISTIRTWLNGTYYDLFDQAVKNNIVEVRIPYRPGLGTSSVINVGSTGLLTKVFLLSGTEAGNPSTAQYSTIEGVILDYFLYGDDTAGSGLLARQRRIAYRDGVAADWWLRSPYLADHSGALSVKVAGNFLIMAPIGTTVAPRPVFVMNETFVA